MLLANEKRSRAPGRKKENKAENRPPKGGKTHQTLSFFIFPISFPFLSIYTVYILYIIIAKHYRKMEKRPRGKKLTLS